MWEYLDPSVNENVLLLGPQLGLKLLQIKAPHLHLMLFRFISDWVFPKCFLFFLVKYVHSLGMCI